jgi:hypothetical protein
MRQLRRFLVVCSLLGVLAVVVSSACSNSSSQSNVTASQACADLAAARCQKMQQCNPQGILNTYGDLATCESRQSATCVSNLAAPQTANSASHTEDCAQATPSVTCSDFALGNVPPACQPPAGPRDAGSPCSVSAQCATAFCLTPRTSSCGTCEVQPAVGSSCANNGCGPGLVCDSKTLLCAMPLGAGGSCDDSSVCGPGFTCIGNSSTANGTCTALATAVGANCDLADAGTRCDGRLGLYCNVPQGRVCAQVGNAAATLACGTIDGGVIDCTAGAFCERPGNSRSGVCVAPASESAACDTADGPTCSSPARCVLTIAGGTAGTCITTNPTVCN